MAHKKVLKSHKAQLTHVSDVKPAEVRVDESARLREIRTLVEQNNKSELSTDIVICQIYMESRFDKNAQAQGSSARGLMQLLKAPVRELYRLDDLRKPRESRQSERDLYREADALHDSPEFIDEAVNIQTGTAYMAALIRKRRADRSNDPIAEAYKDYRGVRNGIYYNKIKAAAEKLKDNPESMQVLREMVN